jgi:hypothetical protein
MTHQSAVVVLAVLTIVAGGTGAAVPANQPADSGAVEDRHAAGSAYAGTYVSFETGSNAVVDYTVGDATVAESIAVQSKSDASGEVGVGVELRSVTGFSAAGLSTGARSETSASVESESGAHLEAHDNPHGTLVVTTGGESQYVTANVSADSEASAESDDRVVVTTAEGAQSTYIVVGEGQVTVNERGNVSADLGDDARLVVRSYAESRSDVDRTEEQLIADGRAAAEVYVTSEADGGSEMAADVVHYSGDTTVDVTEQSQGTLEMTAERAQSEGRIVLTSVSEQAIESTEDLSVTVDGEAATKASSYSELDGAIGSGSSKYMVRQQSAAEATSNVAVAISGFSTRTVRITDDGEAAGSGDESAGRTDEQPVETGGNGADSGTDASSPGPGAAVALLAVLGTTLLAKRRSL